LSSLPSAGEGAETIALLDHYARARWVSEGHDGEVNRTIRDTADKQAAAEGPDAIREQMRQALREIEAVLVDPPELAFIPWQGWSLSSDDFLVTRLMEMVVHSDDLAASLDVAAPDFGPEILDPVMRLLTALAIRRHGQDALVRALTRPQRSPANISAF
jgi:hypothetical protein